MQNPRQHPHAAGGFSFTRVLVVCNDIVTERKAAPGRYDSRRKTDARSCTHVGYDNPGKVPRTGADVREHERSETD